MKEPDTVSRLGRFNVPEAKKEASVQWPLLHHLEKDTTTLHLYRPSRNALEDSEFCRWRGRTQDILFLALFDCSCGPPLPCSTRSASLMLLSLVVRAAIMLKALFQLHQLELLCHVDPMCSLDVKNYNQISVNWLSNLLPMVKMLLAKATSIGAETGCIRYNGLSCNFPTSEGTPRFVNI